MVVDGEVAIVSGWRGWVGAIDLATGTVIRERWVDGELWELVKLRDGRLLGLGMRGDTGIAMTLDAKTLAATPVTLPRPHQRDVEVAVLDDGGVVITGGELPLAIFDPATWLERRVLDAGLGWGPPIALGTTLLVARNTADDDRVSRFDLEAGTRDMLGPARHLAAGGNVIARSVMDAGFDSARVEVEINGKLTHTYPGIDMGIAVDASGSHLLVHSDYDEITIYAMPSGKKVRTVALGQAGAVVRTFEVHGSRALLLADSRLRVLDISTGSITPHGGAPFGRPSSLAVDNAGEVAMIGSGAWRIVRGEVTASLALGGESRLAPPLGEVNRFAVATETAVTLTSFDGKAVRRWPIAQASYPGWFAGDDVALGTWSRHRSQLVRSRGSAFTQVATFNTEATISDVDLRGERAVISWKGTAHAISLEDGARLFHVPIPGCENNAILQPSGRHLATHDEHTITVWDGANARATTRFDDEVVRVAFIPGTDDLVVLLHHHLALWSPATGALRSIGVSSIFELAISPDGRRLALAFGDDRIAVLDVDAFRSAVTIDRAKPAPTPPACPAGSPFGP